MHYNVSPSADMCLRQNGGKELWFFFFFQEKKKSLGLEWNMKNVKNDKSAGWVSRSTF